MDKVFYFLLDYKKTKAAIKTKIDQYNKDLQLLFEAGPAEFREKYSLLPNQGYKALTIKSTEETTMWSVLEMFGGYLQSNAIRKLAPDEFRINNQAICTKKSNRIDPSTVYRHIRKLTCAGVIKEKVFRGSNTSFDLKLNENLIHLRPNQEYNFYLMELYKVMMGDAQVKPQAFRGLSSFSGTLANFPFGFTLASCKHISTGIILLEHKINMESGIVSFDFRLRANSSLENQAANENFDKNLNNKGQIAGQKNLDQVARGGPGAAAGENEFTDFEADYQETMQVGVSLDRADHQKKNRQQAKSEEEKLWKEVLSFYCYATAILWPNRIITTFERNRICAHIYKHFKAALGDNPVIPGVYNFRGTFMFRILLTQKYLKKNPMWTIESPSSYFDFENKRGFNGTVEWVDRSKKMEEQNKLYLDHYRKFIQGWKDFTKQPDMQTYRSVAQTLGKLKNECWVTYFNQGVANLNSIENIGLNEIWKNHYTV